MKRVRVVVCGKGEPLLLVIESLVEDHEISIRAVFVSGTDQDIHSEIRMLCRTTPIFSSSINLHEPLMQDIAPDWLISCQYESILSESILKTCGCAVNIHFSLLPRHRGCAPIFHAIASGDKFIGVTMHVMTKKIDNGPILIQYSHPIARDMVASQAYCQCCDMVRDVMYEFMHKWIKCEEGGMRSVREYALPQNPNEAIYHCKGDVDFSRPEFRFKDFASDYEASCWLRAMFYPKYQNPYFVLDGVRFYIGGVALDG